MVRVDPLHSRNEHFCCYFFSAFYLGKIGQDCEKVCTTVDLGCSPRMETKNDTLVFMEAFDASGNKSSNDLALTSKCETSSDSTAYTKNYNPSYLIQENRCIGYVGVPYKIQCNNTELPSSNVRRLCYCMTPGKISLYIN